MLPIEILFDSQSLGTVSETLTWNQNKHDEYTWQNKNTIKEHVVYLVSFTMCDDKKMKMLLPNTFLNVETLCTH